VNKKTTIQEQACMWLSLQDEKHPSFNQNDLLIWLNEKEDHFIAFEKEKSLKNKIKNIPSSDLKKLSNDVFAEIEADKKRKKIFKTIIPYSIAASLLLVLSFTLLEFLKTPDVLYSKSLNSENRILNNIKLPDDSKISLYTNTSLNVSFYKKTREVSLLEGKAVFSVSSNKDRPFIIKTNHTNIQVIGTKFEVINDKNIVVINVKEGKVKVSRILKDGKKTRILTFLEKGQKVSLDKYGEIKKIEPISTSKIALWEQEKLIFNQTSLKEVMNTFSKFLDIKVHFKSKLSSSYLITGEFEVSKMDDLLKSLPLIHPIIIEKNKDKILIKDKF